LVKRRGIALLLAGAGLALAAAPMAVAQPNCTSTGPGTTICSTPGGSTSITTSPVQSGPYLPAYCDPAYGALCDGGVSISLGPIFDRGGRR